MFDRNLMKLQGMHAIMMALVVLALLQAAAIAGQALTLSSALSALWGGTSLENAIPDIAAFLACFALFQLLRFAQETMLDRYALRQANALHEKLLEKTFDAKTMLAQREGAAVVATMATEGMEEIQTYIRIIPPKIIGMAAISIPLLVVEFSVDWPSGIILTVMFPVIMFFMILLGRQSRDRAERQYASYTRLSNRFMDTLRGIDVIKSFGAEENEGESVFSFSEKLRRATVRTLTTATLSSAVLDFCATFGVAAVAMMLAFRLMDGSIALMTGLAALMIAPEYFTPIRSFASDFHASLDGKNTLAAFLGMMVDDCEDASDAASASTDSRQDPFEWSESSVLEFRDISYTYGESGAGVKRVSFSLRGFEKVGIVGKSGAGKTTIAHIVAGFYTPTSGEVLLDGQPFSLDDPTWKRHVRVIPQNPYVFRASIADNIRFYNPAATDEQVEKAVHAVGLETLVDSLPEDLETLVGEGARGLSGGQAHRIALARILLDDDARILVFDEPTAHLDIETELELKERMVPLMEGRLVLFATHRLHWTRDMDRVITLADGAVASVETVAKKEDAARGSDQVLANQVETIANVHTAPYEQPSEDDGESTSAHADPSSREGAFGKIPAPMQASTLEPKGKEDNAAKPRRSYLPAWFKDFLARYKRSVVVALLLGLLASGCAALLMFTSGYLISATALPGITLFAVMVPVAFVQLFGFGRPVARYLERLVSHNWVLKVTSDLRYSLYETIARRAGDPLFERATGEYLGILADDIAHLQNLYLRVVFPIAIAFLLAIAAVIAFGVFSLPFALVMLVVFALTAFVVPLLSQVMTSNGTIRVKSLKADEFALITDDILGCVDWILSGRSPSAVSSHVDSNGDIRKLDAKMRMTQRIFSLISTLLLGVAVCVVIGWAANAFGSWEKTGMAANWIAAFALGFFPLIEAFAALPAAFSQGTAHLDAIERLDPYLASDDVFEVNASEGAIDSSIGESDYASWNSDGSPQEQGDEQASQDEATAEAHSRESGGAPSDSETNGQSHIDNAVSLEGVTYAYPQGTAFALHNLTLVIRENSSTAILGPSGSGKSTIAKIVRGAFTPTCGSVHTNGHVGYLGQTPYLFNRTLRENLTLGVLEATDEELVDMLASVGLASKLESLDEGLDTVIGETGVGFSGGEAHRIALARLLVAGDPIVLVDEPFAALDPETESDLLDTLFETCADKTLIVITHHLAHIERFDHVLFMVDGRIDLSGSPADLAETSDRFRALVEFDRVL